MSTYELAECKLLVAQLYAIWRKRQEEERKDNSGAKLDLFLLLRSRKLSNILSLTSFSVWDPIEESFDGPWELFIQTVLGIMTSKAKRIIENKILIDKEEDEK